MTPEYKTYQAMKIRCNNPHTIGWKNYGGRGIKVCKRWNESYLAFLEDMGRKPSEEYSIDRINNNKGYSKKNCRWTLIKEQNKNRRGVISYKGETMTDAAIRLGMCREAISQRIKRGLPKEIAFNLPKQEGVRGVTLLSIASEY